MDAKELRNKTPAELAADLVELRREQFNLRMQRGTGQLTQTHQLRKVRRDIARLKTAISTKK
ncbi:MAG: 50S ribosomal protein L29 [Pseudomonadota bacterium]|jgi:large subunit ribosomal protein L29